MEDVIYSGGPGKSAVGMAEVMLTIDNADQRLNVEFNEIEVARRLYRSGESEYLINGARARLKDIDALLASTGLRQDGYAVTAQNDIDFVIQAAPALRRDADRRRVRTALRRASLGITRRARGTLAPPGSRCGRTPSTRREPAPGAYRAGAQRRRRSGARSVAERTPTTQRLGASRQPRRR